LAFGEFYEQHWQQLLVCLTRQVGDAETGVDLMSETFAVALEKCSQFRGTSPAEEAGWLYSIARTQLSRYWRSGRVERAALARLGVQTAELTDPEIDRIEHLAALATLSEQLDDALETLPADQREAIQLRVVEELAYPDVARQLEVSEQVVRARVSRGLRTLSQRLQPDTVGGGVS